MLAMEQINGREKNCKLPRVDYNELIVNYTRRERVRVVIYTLSCRIIGDLHIIPQSRLTDMLNVKAKDFFPLTDVK